MIEGLPGAVMDGQASGPGMPRNGCRERRLDTYVGTAAPGIP